MKKKLCADCREHSKCRDSLVSWVFFVVGLVATVAVRVVTVLMEVNPLYAKIAWYTGVSGFFAFFIYKFKVSMARAGLIRRGSLVDKLSGRKQLTDADYDLLENILCSVSSRKERVNFLFIFVLSALALLAALYIDFF